MRTFFAGRFFDGTPLAMESNVVDDSDGRPDSSDSLIDTSLRGMLTRPISMRRMSKPRPVADRRSAPLPPTEPLNGAEPSTSTAAATAPCTSAEEPESTLNLSLDSVVRQSLRDQKLTTNFNSNFKFGKPDDDISLRVNPMANLFYARPPITRASSDSSSYTDDSSRDADLNDQSASDVRGSGATGSANSTTTNISVKVAIDGGGAGGRVRSKRAKQAKAAKREQIVPQPSTSGMPSRKRSRPSPTAHRAGDRKGVGAPNEPHVTSSSERKADSVDFQCECERRVCVREHCLRRPSFNECRLFSVYFQLNCLVSMRAGNHHPINTGSAQGRPYSPPPPPSPSNHEHRTNRPPHLLHSQLAVDRRPVSRSSVYSQWHGPAETDDRPNTFVMQNFKYFLDKLSLSMVEVFRSNKSMLMSTVVRSVGRFELWPDGHRCHLAAGYSHECTHHHLQLHPTHM